MKVFMCVPLALVLLLMGCGDTGSSTDTGEGVENPSLSQDVQPILEANCTGCHGPSSPRAGYSLASYAGILGNGSDDKANVVPGKSSESPLYQRVERGEMPPGNPLASKDIATIENWIEQGAQDN